MITSGRGASCLDLIGEVTSVYEDLGPAHRVSVTDLKKGGVYTFDVEDFPFPANEVELLVGKKIHFRRVVEVRILDEADTGGLAP
jgi:hypothetical protein